VKEIDPGIACSIRETNQGSVELMIVISPFLEKYRSSPLPAVITGIDNRGEIVNSHPLNPGIPVTGDNLIHGIAQLTDDCDSPGKGIKPIRCTTIQATINHEDIPVFKPVAQ
jgi:hypothetical protein